MVELRGGLDKLGQHGITKMLILQYVKDTTPHLSESN